jgi:hypothetical protein
LEKGLEVQGDVEELEGERVKGKREGRRVVKVLWE